MPARTREATHAGSWYTSNGDQLRSELEGYLGKVTELPELGYAPPIQDAKAIIAPHAGYSYSGPTAAWAYAAMPTAKIHHAYVSGAALSRFQSYATPIGDIPLCLETVAELRKSGIFSDMKSSVDEDEHSLEMHLPYIRHMFSGRDDLRLVPILVGHPDPRTSVRLSEILARYWKQDDTFFVISSDFCHWGTRFSCTPYYPTAPPPPFAVAPVPQETVPASFEPPALVRRFDKVGKTPIWQSIQYMDHEGMSLLREPAGPGAAEKWEAYLERTKNTICGRNPISVLVNLIQYVYAGKDAAQQPKFTFVRYEQSSRCMTGRDSSVSYVSGVLRIPGE